MLAEFSQESDRPEAPLASAPSVTNHTLAPRRARWYALETPIAPPPMTATLGCVWLLMLLTSIEALGLQQDQRQHSFKGPTPDILCRHRCPAPQPIAVQVTARPTDLGSSCPTDFGSGERGFLALADAAESASEHPIARRSPRSPGQRGGGGGGGGRGGGPGA